MARVTKISKEAHIGTESFMKSRSNFYALVVSRIVLKNFKFKTSYVYEKIQEITRKN